MGEDTRARYAQTGAAVTDCAIPRQSPRQDSNLRPSAYHERIEPLDGLEPPSSRYERDTLPGELQRRELPILASNQEPPEPESGALPFLS